MYGRYGQGPETVAAIPAGMVALVNAGFAWWFFSHAAKRKPLPNWYVWYKGVDATLAALMGATLAGLLLYKGSRPTFQPPPWGVAGLGAIEDQAWYNDPGARSMLPLTRSF